LGKARRTGGGFIILLVCLKYNGAVWRMNSGAVCFMNSMREGCIWRTFVALNMIAVVGGRAQM
jgi:hypothetical protein